MHLGTCRMSCASAAIAWLQSPESQELSGFSGIKVAAAPSPCTTVATASASGENYSCCQSGMQLSNSPSCTDMQLAVWGMLNHVGKEPEGLRRSAAASAAVTNQAPQPSALRLYVGGDALAASLHKICFSAG